MITIGIIMTASIFINILLVWYVTVLLKKFFFISDNVEDLSDILAGLAKHLGQVHGLETFYGEPVLQSLLRHTRDVVEEIDRYKAIYNVEEAEEAEEAEEDEEVGEQEQEIDE